MLRWINPIRTLDDPRAAAVLARLPDGVSHDRAERLLMLRLATDFSVGKANTLITAAWLDGDPRYIAEAERWLQEVGLGADPALRANLAWARRAACTWRRNRGRPRNTLRDLELLSHAGMFADFGLAKLDGAVPRFVDRRAENKLFAELQASLAAGVAKNEAVGMYLAALRALPTVGARRAPRFSNAGSVERLPKQAKAELAKRFKISSDALERTFRRLRARWRKRLSIGIASQKPD